MCTRRRHLCTLLVQRKLIQLILRPARSKLEDGSDLMGINGDLVGICGLWMVISQDFMGFNGIYGGLPSSKLTQLRKNHNL